MPTYCQNALHLANLLPNHKSKYTSECQNAIYRRQQYVKEHLYSKYRLWAHRQIQPTLTLLFSNMTNRFIYKHWLENLWVFSFPRKKKNYIFEIWTAQFNSVNESHYLITLKAFDEGNFSVKWWSHFRYQEKTQIIFQFTADLICWWLGWLPL